MRISARLQLLTCLLVYVSSTHAIMVKFGTKGGPIEPPAPEPKPSLARPQRAPAPVWEERSSDLPDPNAQWRPQPVKTQPLYTHVVYSAPALNNAQRFVNAYIPKPQPIQAQPITNYFTPAQILSSQRLPGVGLRYFVPLYVNDDKKRIENRQEDTVHNQLETNEVDGQNTDSSSDLQWKYEKAAAKRIIRNTPEAVVPLYLWPEYVPRRQ